MAKEYGGDYNAQGLRFAVIVSRFNEGVTERLLKGALDTLRRCGALEENLTVVRVPGSFEIPVVAERLAKSGNFDALVCLGCLVRGETPHFEFLASEVTRGLGALSRDSGVPVAYGVLTANTVEQALDRAGLKHGNKGAEAALTAVEMARLLRRLDG